MDINLHGITGQINFKWDMLPREYDAMFEPLPAAYHDLSDYIGAVFFGKLKLEFIRNDVAGIYCNLFEYDADDGDGNAYAYLEDGTPYEERYEIGDAIRTPDLRDGQINRPEFTAFAEDIERQIIALLDEHPEYIKSALGPTDPNKWYPCDHPYHIDEITREA